MATKIVIEIKNCQKCPFFRTANEYSTDGWDRMEDWMCAKTYPHKVIQGGVEWHEESKIQIPEWCPIKE